MKPKKNTFKIADFGAEIRYEHLTLAIGIHPSQPDLSFRFDSAKTDPLSAPNYSYVPSKLTGHWNTACLDYNNKQLALVQECVLTVTEHLTV
jgi:hypothetical protein